MFCQPMYGFQINCLGWLFSSVGLIYKITFKDFFDHLLKKPYIKYRVIKLKVFDCRTVIQF